MSVKDATMSAKDATMSAKESTMSAKDATISAKDAIMSAKARPWGESRDDERDHERRRRGDKRYERQCRDHEGQGRRP